MIDPLQRFTAAAGLYERHRPGYPDELVAWLRRESGVGSGARVVDLGCGTGISSRLFAGHGYVVVGIEPNAEMRARAVAAGGGPSYREGRAEATGLDDASADLLIAAQAFHWFDADATMREIDRLLAPGGWACVFSNQRDHSPLDADLEALMVRRSSAYGAAQGNRRDNLAGGQARLGRRHIDAAVHRVEQLDWDAWSGRVHSASYVVHDIDDRDAFDRELRAIYERYAEDNRVAIPMRTEMSAWPGARTLP